MLLHAFRHLKLYFKTFAIFVAFPYTILKPSKRCLKVCCEFTEIIFLHLLFAQSDSKNIYAYNLASDFTIFMQMTNKGLP